MLTHDLLASFLLQVWQMGVDWIWAEWGKLQTPYTRKEDCKNN
jgi:hypothetical protein